LLLPDPTQESWAHITVDSKLGGVMKGLVDKTIDALAHLLESKWLEARKDEIESADGRKDRGNPICRTSSCLYVAYSSNNVLYVGETSKSIKRRFNSDGSGSHKQACSWYSKMTHVRYVVFDDRDLPVQYRKFLEQALSIHFNPEFYGSRM
jgi:predicted GIY-YIG superfamily endonuclease